jgi:hypothetical protein
MSPSPPKKKAIFTWGRFNPPTIGHKALVDQLLIRATETGADPFIVVTHTTEPVNENPLFPPEKQNIFQTMYPAVEILTSSHEEPNPVYLVNKLRERGYGEIFFILGSDRNKHFSFVKNVTRIIPGIKRNQTAEGSVGMSATKARGFAVANQWEKFRSAINSSVPNEKTRHYMDIIRERITTSVAEPKPASKKRKSTPKSAPSSNKKAKNAPSPKSVPSTGTRSSARLRRN